MTLGEALILGSFLTSLLTFVTIPWRAVRRPMGVLCLLLFAIAQLFIDTRFNIRVDLILGIPMCIGVLIVVCAKRAPAPSERSMRRNERR